MYQVLIVDDEPRHRRGMINMIKNLRPDYRIFEAKNGKEAIDLIFSNHVDIVVTDVKMPIMDGIQFMEALGDCISSLKVVILSGYAYFEYAQKALKLGAFDYMLKPVDEEKIENMLSKLEKSLEREESAKAEKDNMKKKLDESLMEYSEHQMNKWINGYLDKSELKEIEKIFSSWGMGNVILTDMGKYEHIIARYGNAEFAEIKQNIKYRMQELLNPLGHSLSFFLEGNQFTLISILNASVGLSICSEESLKRLEEFITYIGTDYGIDATIALSRDCGNIFNEINVCSEEAKKTLKLKFYLGRRKVINNSEIAFCSNEQLLVRHAEEESLIEAVRITDRENVKGFIDVIFEKLTSIGYPDTQKLITYMVRLVTNAVKSVQDVLPGDYSRELFASVERLYDCEEYCVLQEEVKRILLCTIDRLSDNKDKRNELIIKKCIEYIDKYYMEDLSLELIAGKFHFNATYFSSFFKNYIGITLSTYLLRTRIKKAQSLLESTDYKVYEVANRVGYRDVKYFNRVFKKELGLTPDEYRRAK